MTKPKRTEGPWIARFPPGSTGYWYIDSISEPTGCGGVATHYRNNPVDAHTLAAAWELLESLKEVLPLAEAYLAHMPDRHGHHVAKIERARAALAKADGEG